MRYTKRRKSRLKNRTLLFVALAMLLGFCGLLFVYYINRPINFYGSYQGLLTPMDGSYNDWVYNTMNVMDDKIYYTFNHPQTHWNSAGDQGTTLGIYDPKNGEKTYKEISYNGEPVSTHTGWISDNVYYVMDQTDLYYSDDKGDSWKHDSVNGLNHSPNYLYQLTTGRLIVVFDDRNFKGYALSDDNGKNWIEYNAFDNEYEFTHVSFAETEDCLVAYFFEDYWTSQDNGNEVRCYSLSYDQGLTWSKPQRCQGELADAGLGYMSGTIQYMGGKYHYITGERLYPCEENGYSLGQLKWYAGTKEELMSGNLTLQEAVYDMKINPEGNFYWPVSCSDFGNVGGCVWKDNIFIACGTLVDSEKVSVLSTQQQRLFMISTKKRKSVVDEWNDEQWMKKIESAMKDKDISSWDYYFYDPNTQNMFVDNILYSSTHEGSGTVVAQDNYYIDLGNGDYVIEVVYQMSNLANGLFIGVQHPDGSCDGIGRGDVNVYGFNCGIDMNTAMLPCGPGGDLYPAYMIIEKIGNDYTVTVNGTTIANWRYHWNYNIQDTIINNNVINQERFVIFQNGIEDWITNASEWDMNNQICGIKMCRIKLKY